MCEATTSCNLMQTLSSDLVRQKANIHFCNALQIVGPHFMESNPTQSKILMILARLRRLRRVLANFYNYFFRISCFSPA